MKKLVLFVCFIYLFHTNETEAIGMKYDVFNYDSIASYVLKDENSIVSFCRDKKMNICKGEKDECLLSENYLKAIFLGVRKNNQLINMRNFAYCVKYGYVKISNDNKEPSDNDYLVYYFITLDKKDTPMNRYISELKCKPYDVVTPTMEIPYVCYLFMKGDTLVTLSVDLWRRNDFAHEDMEKLIERIKK